MKITMNKSLFKAQIWILFFGLVLTAFHTEAGTGKEHDEVRSILQSYASDYEEDVMLTREVSFGIKVGEEFWTVEAKPKSEGQAASVTLTEGKPQTPTFYFFTDAETLGRVNRGEMNALTASAKAFSSDFAPFDVDVMDGFQPDGSFMSSLFSVYFHFWTRGFPEKVPFNLGTTRTTHGAQASIFYYQPGFRSAYVAIKKGQHANENEKSRTNPFPTLLIGIGGSGKAIIGGKETSLKAGEAMVIPPGVTHEFMNPDNEEPFEAILLMFGEGA